MLVYNCNLFRPGCESVKMLRSDVPLQMCSKEGTEGALAPLVLALKVSVSFLSSRCCWIRNSACGRF